MHEFGEEEDKEKQMNKINFGRVVLAGLVAALVFFFVEIVLEGFVFLIFGVCEAKLFKEYLGYLPSGTLYHILNLGIFFAICILIMWVYAAIRPRFASNAKAAIGTSLVFWLLVFLFLGNFVNTGILPLEAALLSLGFNLIELPIGILVGSLLYKDKKNKISG
jgi:hypothetical protein